MLGTFFLASGLALTLFAQWTKNTTQPTSIDETKFPTVEEVKNLVSQICGDGLRLPGSEQHKKVVNFIKCQLSGIPGLSINKTEFDIGG